MYIPKGFKKNTLIKYPQLNNFYRRLGESTIVEIDTPPGFSRIFSKCEWNHPAGTIKAKVALAMMWRLLDNLEEDSTNITVLEYSGGGLSMALAELCHDLKIKCVLTLIETTPKSIINVSKSFNAEVVLTKKELGFWGVMEKAMELKQQHPNWKFLYQHTNWANYDFHSQITAREIINSNIDSIDVLVASVGTGGTLTGIYNGIKQKFPKVKLHTNMPAEMPYGTNEPSNSLPKFSGSGGLGCGRKQMFIERLENEIVAHHVVSYEEAKESMLEFYLKSKMVIGSSAAANLRVAYKIAENLGSGSVVLTVFPSLALPEEKDEILKKIET